MIIQAEYDEYYPLDGLEESYYSVFVETDLNIASDIVGNKLGSVDGIADYIAGNTTDFQCNLCGHIHT